MAAERLFLHKVVLGIDQVAADEAVCLSFLDLLQFAVVSLVDLNLDVAVYAILESHLECAFASSAEVCDVPVDAEVIMSETALQVFFLDGWSNHKVDNGIVILVEHIMVNLSLEIVLTIF